MSSWDTPSAVSVGEKPKNHHHRAEVVQLVKASHRNLKELVLTKQQKCSLQKTDTRVHNRCCEFTGIHWRAALWPYPWVLQQCSKPNHDKPFRKALWTDIHTTAQHQTQNFPFTHWNFPPAHLSLGWIQTEYHGALYLNSCGKKRILYKRDRFMALIGAQKKVLLLNNQPVKWIHCILPPQRQKLVTWVCMWKQHSLPPNLTEPGPVQDRWVPPLWYKAMLFHCLQQLISLSRDVPGVHVSEEGSAHWLQMQTHYGSDARNPHSDTYQQPGCLQRWEAGSFSEKQQFVQWVQKDPFFCLFLVTQTRIHSLNWVKALHSQNWLKSEVVLNDLNLHAQGQNPWIPECFKGTQLLFPSHPIRV